MIGGYQPKPVMGKIIDPPKNPNDPQTTKGSMFDGRTADCKSVGESQVGSIPTLPTNSQTTRGASWVI